MYAREQATQVTVFVYSAPEEPRKHTARYWDDAALVVVDRLPTDPLVPPTRAPTRRPTSTPAPTATATLTPPPTATSTLTPIPPSPTTPPFSTICLQAFDDLNGNTRWDTQAEPALAGVTFSLSSTRGISEIVYTSGGFTEPHCLANFPAGDYHLSIEPPAGYEATTARQWQLALSAGSCVEVDFGSRRIEAQALPASRQESATVEPIAWVALAVVVGVIVVFLRRRRRAF